MAEYIEREAALDIVKRTSGDYAAAFTEIAHIPASDVAPVRHERWIWKQGVCEDEYLKICSCCKCECHSYYDDEEGMTMYIPSNYCPNCGAQMEGS